MLLQLSFLLQQDGTHLHTSHLAQPDARLYISMWVKQKKGTANSLTVHRNGRRVKRKWLPFPVVENFPGTAGTHSSGSPLFLASMLLKDGLWCELPAISSTHRAELVPVTSCPCCTARAGGSPCLLHPPAAPALYPPWASTGEWGRISQMILKS